MTIALDFDGPIHRYSRGWQDGTIYDEPTPGALDAIRYLMEREAVFIHTTRPPEPVAVWLAGHGLETTTNDRCPSCLVMLTRLVSYGRADCEDCHGSGLVTFWDKRGLLLVTNRKLPAYAYVDDRAVLFTPEGGWAAAVEAVREFAPHLRDDG